MDFKAAINIPCNQLERRGSLRLDKGVFEWQFAEAAALTNFREHFESTHPGGVVVDQLEYRSLKSHDAAIKFYLATLNLYFRNWYSRRNSSREGGFRKPDGLGIWPGGRLMEFIEVKPYYDYHEAGNQLNEMVAKVRDGFAAFCKEKSIERGVSLPFDPDSISVRGSPWKPSGDELVVTPSDAAWAKDKSWICFKPTIYPPGGVILTEGVVLYEIHSLKASAAKTTGF